MKQGYGSSDSDRIGKEKTDKPLKGPGTDAHLSAMVGGVSNAESPPATKPTSNGLSGQGGSPKPSGSGIPPYVEGGFRNAAMEHKR